MAGPHTDIPEDPQAVEEPQAKRFTWTIQNFSRQTTKKIYSDVFVAGGFKWRVLIFPKGNNIHQLSLYLDAADSSSLRYGWSRDAQFSLAVVNQIHNKFTIRKDTQHQFHARESDWGFTSFMPLSDLYDPCKGYIVNDTCIIEADVRVPNLQKEAAKTSTAKTTVIAPLQRDDDALNAIRTVEGEKDILNSLKACNKADLDIDGSDSSSSSVSIAKMRTIVHDVDEDDDSLSEILMNEDDDSLSESEISYEDDEISKGVDGNPSCKDLQLEYVKPVINDLNGSVMIPSDVVNRGSLPYSRTLYGFFFKGIEIEFSLVNYHIRKMWSTHGIENIMMNGKGFYLFKFKTDEGMLDALERGPWRISDTPIFLKRWTPGLTLDKSKHDKLPVWIKVYDIPLELWNKEGLSIISSMLGNPLAVDTCTARMLMNASGRAGYARVLVDVDLNGNWVDEVSVSIPFGNEHLLSTLRIKYSWKPAKCSICNVFDHTDSNCIHQTLIAKDKGKKDSNILHREVLDIPLPKFQCRKTLKVAFHHATKEEPVILYIRLPKQSTVGDVLNVIKTKVKLTRQDAELRLFEMFYHKIHKIFPPTEKIENINDQQWTLRAEEIPEEEKNLGPQDQLIPVSHFTKEAAQNQMQVQNFGEPFFLVIHENETLAAVKVRIQKKLEIPDEEFSKWKFASLSLGRPEYLEDSDIVSTRFQKKDYGAWEPYLGLEHSDTTPKRPSTANQNRHI